VHCYQGVIDMSIGNPLQPLIPKPPTVPPDHKKISVWIWRDYGDRWHDYRDKWQNYLQRCRTYWKQHNLEGEIEYWPFLRAAQDAYRVTQDANHRKAQDEYHKHQDAFRKYKEACDKAQKAYRPYKQALDREEEITRWKYLADADHAYREADEAKKQGQLKKGIDEWFEYFCAWLDYRKAWCKHWDALGQPWRTEPEINDRRQRKLRKYLTGRKATYPFQGIKLDRADVEWLLVTHEDGRGQVDWDDENQREREGLDLRGADLRGVDLSRLPLARMLGGLAESKRGNDKQWECRCQEAAVRLEDSTLFEAHLEGAQLQFAHPQRANLDTAHLEGARLYRAELEGANLRYAYLDRATNLDSTNLDGAYIADVRWGDVNLALVAWERVVKLGDELKAERKSSSSLSERTKQGSRQMLGQLASHSQHE
jgi:hypothetical protein